MYRVFTGAPKAKYLLEDISPYQWQTVASNDKPRTSTSNSLAQMPTSTQFPLPPATLEAASRRISMIYQNALFGGEGAGDESEREYSIL